MRAILTVQNICYHEHDYDGKADACGDDGNDGDDVIKMMMIMMMMMKMRV